MAAWRQALQPLCDRASFIGNGVNARLTLAGNDQLGLGNVYTVKVFRSRHEKFSSIHQKIDPAEVEHPATTLACVQIGPRDSCSDVTEAQFFIDVRAGWELLKLSVRGERPISTLAFLTPAPSPYKRRERSEHSEFRSTAPGWPAP